MCPAGKEISLVVASPFTSPRLWAGVLKGSASGTHPWTEPLGQWQSLLLSCGPPGTAPSWGMPNKCPAARTPLLGTWARVGAHRMLRADWGGNFVSPGPCAHKGGEAPRAGSRACGAPRDGGLSSGRPGATPALLVPSVRWGPRPLSPSRAAGAGLPQPLPLEPWRCWGHSCGRSDSVSLWASLRSSAVPQPPLPPASVPRFLPPLQALPFHPVFLFFLERRKRCHGEASAESHKEEERRGARGGGG